MKMRKGFTLVELLIVIVIIGILAAAMMLSSGSATASARAATIISDMRSIKAACLIFYADSMDSKNGNTLYTITDIKTALGSSSGGGDGINALKPYMDNPEKLEKYTLVYDDSGTDKLYITFASGKEPDTDVNEKLEGRAASVGLYDDDDYTKTYGEGNGNACMIAF